MNTDHINATQMHRIPACTADACGQDSSRCKTRDACWLPECEREMNDWATAGLDVLKVMGIVMVCAVVANAIF